MAIDWRATGEYALRVLQILRPRYFNRLTWLVVVAGLAIVSAPIWESVVSALLRKHLQVNIPVGASPAWGFALCVLGLLYHMANTGFYDLLKSQESRARKSKEHEHDARIFNESEAILGERKLLGFLDQLQDDHSYFLDRSGLVDRYARYCSSSANRFLTLSLSTATGEMLDRWHELAGFLTVKFFVFPNGPQPDGIRLCMTPGLNMDREGDGSIESNRMYDALTDQLDDLVTKLRQSYEDYRAAVKVELVI